MKVSNSDEQLNLPIMKIVIIGESGVGKSNIISRYALDKFHVCSNATIGVQFISKVIKMDGRDILLQVWDTAGQQKYRALNRSFYRNALGAIVVFSQGDQQSFKNLPKWIEQIRQNSDQQIVLLLAGNKCDLKQQNISVIEATQFAKNQKMAYLQTSAALNINIKKAFEMITNKTYQIHKNKFGIQCSQIRSSVLESIHSRKKKKLKNKKKCCQ